MYERLTEIRPLDVIILALLGISILFNAITYGELDIVRGDVQQIKIEVGK